MAEISHRTIRTNGISMHIAEAGQGPAVIMLHGWPELWYSWRHQLHALADAGYHAIAPDMRGYGGTDAPADPAQYTMKILCADIAGLCDALAIEKAVFVGHDWGGAVLWQMGLRYPGRTRALIGLNTPYGPPGGTTPTSIALRNFWGLTDQTFYMRYFQTSAAQEEFEADVRTNLRKIFMDYRRSEDFTTFMKVGGDGSGVFTRIERTDTFLTDEELDVYVREFERTGIRGGLNWYRGADLNIHETDAPKGPLITGIPAMMVTAGKDTILKPEMAAAMPTLVPGIRMEHIEECMHWTQQERPAEVNALMLDFLKGLEP